jgi:hypothetical protein
LEEGGDSPKPSTGSRQGREESRQQAMYEKRREQAAGNEQQMGESSEQTARLQGGKIDSHTTLALPR